MPGYLRAFSLAMAGLSLTPAAAAQTRPDEKAFFDLYKELVETNTVVNQGSCTRAAQQIATSPPSSGCSGVENSTRSLSA